MAVFCQPDGMVSVPGTMCEQGHCHLWRMPVSSPTAPMLQTRMLHDCCRRSAAHFRLRRLIRSY
ncbi:hypothetical protein BAUCODRAFT_36458 [Baudoinia panamericana UAMH 10762]|uniref:Uncharacterized protein n=1 Tax=Baudoinia panamericana (strain UAMH 10762) TaxID=717646 RepID=M2MBW5_BAUPA|nr:uncharacterized protein BAUCODRAFT_36458 [Baudoinia panamericana UAMH 10762]EMC93986.1 hypothetical protein BAUCODRAFT_36458 [Baudoinia panamericana UAMH 10762]